MVTVHGGDIYSAQEDLQCNIIDFSANINPLGLQEVVKNAIMKNIELCEHYPDPLNRKLRAAIALYEQIDMEQILCGNGAADLIFRIAYAFRPSKALLIAPTFAEYELALQSSGAEILHHYLDKENDFHITNRILDDITSDINMMFLCNPNNPTGQIINDDLVIKILERCEQSNTVLIIDECFLDFVDTTEHYSMIRKLKQFPNLIILKAFTKIFAMPGLRLGYALSSNQDYLERIKNVAQPWSVSVLAEHAGIAALSEIEYIEKTRRLIKDERSYLIKQLKKLKLYVYGSEANYIFFRCCKKIDLKKQLYPKGILIRSCSNYHGLDEQYYRIAVRKHHENEALIAALKDVLK